MTHTWEIHSLESNISNGLILSASWFCRTHLEGQSTRTSSEIALNYKNPSDSDFISYENVTPDLVLSWITGSIDTTALYSKHSQSIADNINYQNSITTTKGTPW